MSSSASSSSSAMRSSTDEVDLPMIKLSARMEGALVYVVRGGPYSLEQLQEKATARGANLTTDRNHRGISHISLPVSSNALDVALYCGPQSEDHYIIRIHCPRIVDGVRRAALSTGPEVITHESWMTDGAYLGRGIVGIHQSGAPLTASAPACPSLLPPPASSISERVVPESPKIMCYVPRHKKTESPAHVPTASATLPSTSVSQHLISSAPAISGTSGHAGIAVRVGGLKRQREASSGEAGSRVFRLRFEGAKEWDGRRLSVARSGVPVLRRPANDAESFAHLCHPAVVFMIRGNLKALIRIGRYMPASNPLAVAPYPSELHGFVGPAPRLDGFVLSLWKRLWHISVAAGESRDEILRILRVNTAPIAVSLRDATIVIAPVRRDLVSPGKWERVKAAATQGGRGIVVDLKWWQACCGTGQLHFTAEMRALDERTGA